MRLGVVLLAGQEYLGQMQPRTWQRGSPPSIAEVVRHTMANMFLSDFFLRGPSLLSQAVRLQSQMWSEQKPETLHGWRLGMDRLLFRRRWWSLVLMLWVPLWQHWAVAHILFRSRSFPQIRCGDIFRDGRDTSFEVYFINPDIRSFSFNWFQP